MSERRYARTKRLRERRKAAGLCARCGKFPPAPGKIDCASCARKEWLRIKRWRYSRPGRCVLCSLEALEGLKWCEPCARYASAWRKRRSSVNRLSKWSLNRRDVLTKRAKILSGFSASEWKQVESWVRQHSELWAENSDPVLYGHKSLRIEE